MLKPLNTATSYIIKDISWCVFKKVIKWLTLSLCFLPFHWLLGATRPNLVGMNMLNHIWQFPFTNWHKGKMPYTFWLWEYLPMGIFLCTVYTRQNKDDWFLIEKSTTSCTNTKPNLKLILTTKVLVKFEPISMEILIGAKLQRN